MNFKEIINSLQNVSAIEIRTILVHAATLMDEREAKSRKEFSRLAYRCRRQRMQLRSLRERNAPRGDSVGAGLQEDLVSRETLVPCELKPLVRRFENLESYRLSILRTPIKIILIPLSGKQFSTEVTYTEQKYSVKRKPSISKVRRLKKKKRLQARSEEKKKIPSTAEGFFVEADIAVLQQVLDLTTSNFTLKEARDLAELEPRQWTGRRSSDVKMVLCRFRTSLEYLLSLRSLATKRIPKDYIFRSPEYLVLKKLYDTALKPRT